MSEQLQIKYQSVVVMWRIYERSSYEGTPRICQVPVVRTTASWKFFFYDKLFAQLLRNNCAHNCAKKLCARYLRTFLRYLRTFFSQKLCAMAIFRKKFIFEFGTCNKKKHQIKIEYYWDYCRKNMRLQYIHNLGTCRGVKASAQKQAIFRKKFVFLFVTGYLIFLQGSMLVIEMSCRKNMRGVLLIGFTNCAIVRFSVQLLRTFFALKLCAKLCAHNVGDKLLRSSLAHSCAQNLCAHLVPTGFALCLCEIGIDKHMRSCFAFKICADCQWVRNVRKDCAQSCAQSCAQNCAQSSCAQLFANYLR